MGWSKEELFTNPVLFSDILKLEMGTVLYEDILEKKKMIKTIEEK